MATSDTNNKSKVKSLLNEYRLNFSNSDATLDPPSRKCRKVVNSDDSNNKKAKDRICVALPQKQKSSLYTKIYAQSDAWQNYSNFYDDGSMRQFDPTNMLDSTYQQIPDKDPPPYPNQYPTFTQYPSENQIQTRFRYPNSQSFKNQYIFPKLTPQFIPSQNQYQALTQYPSYQQLQNQVNSSYQTANIPQQYQGCQHINTYSSTTDYRYSVPSYASNNPKYSPM